MSNGSTFVSTHCWANNVCQFDLSLRKCDFPGSSVTKIFFQEICSSGGKQTIHQVSAAFIVKNCHPRTSLSPFFYKS